MRYNAFFGELPIDAFKPIGGRMSLYGGKNPISSVADAVSSAVSDVGNIAGSVVDSVGSAVGDVVSTVADNPLQAAALAAGGYTFAPELGAWIGSDGTALAGTADGVAAGTAPTTADALQASTAFDGSLPAGSAYTAPNVTTLGNVAGSTEGMASGTSVADMGGAQGLQGAGYGNVSSMGGGQGLYGVSPTGTSVSEMGGTLSNGGLGAGIGSGIGAGIGAGSAGANTLAGMLPYMTAAQVGTGLVGAYAANQGANAQANAATNAANLQQQNFNTINQQQTPGRASGANAFNTLGSMGTGNYNTYDAAGNVTGTGQGSGYLQHQFNAADLAAGLAPNYDFMLQQGQMANQRAANAAGGGLSGNALQGLQNYTQNYAGNAYQNAFNNYQTQRTGIYNTLAGIAGLGQNAQGATNTAATNATNAASQLGVGSAAAQAAGTTGVANALGNTANNVVNNYTLASLLNQKGTVPLQG